MKKRKFVASVMVFSMLLGQTAYAQEMVMPVESAEALEAEQEIEVSEVSVEETDVIEETEEINTIGENAETENIEDTESAEVLTSEDSENYSVLQEGKNSLEVTEGGQKAIGSFSPEESREYVFAFISENNILGSYEVEAELYDSEMNLLASENNINTSDDFKFTYTLEAGQTYYISVKYNFDWNTGTVDFGVFRVADNVTWSVDEEGTLTIQGDGALEDYNGQEPWAGETIKKLVIGEGITDLSDNTFSNSDITSVSLPSGLMKIPKSCFNSCYYLEEINIPESIEKIGSYAFSGCSALRKIVIPDSVTNFGESVFPSVNVSEYFCIVGVKGSAAETYADENDIPFVDIDNPVFSLDRCQISLKHTIVEYDGTEKKPEVIIMDGRQKLAEGEDYTIVYKDNVEIGTGRAIITGIGHYEGTAECTFDIKERKLYEKNMIIGNSWYETKNYDYDADWNREYRWIAANLNNITVESDDPSVCEAVDYEIQEDNYNTIPEQKITLKLHALKTGAAMIYVKDSDGTVLFETQVHVVETPENAVIFEDPVLQMEMTDSYDRDKNGYLTEDEIPSYDYLSLKCVYHGEYVQSLDGLDKMEKVTSLDLQDCNEVRNFSAVNQMSKLESLHISNAEMESMEWLQAREVLRSLTLTKCAVDSWKGLEKMTDLESLTLNHVGFSSAEVLSDMQNLKTLDLSYNEEFTDIQSLSALKSLNCLKLDNTGITDEEKWNFEAIPDEVTLNQGDTYKVLKYSWLIDVETSIVDGDSVVGDGYYRNEFDALEPGTAKIHVSYTDQLNKDVIIHVTDEVHEHTVVTDEAVTATTDHPGKTEGSHCSECGEVLTAQKDTVVTTPLNAAKVDDKGGIDVSWKKVSYADGYLVYRKSGKESWKRVTELKSADDNSWTDTTGTIGTAYTYTVRAYMNSNGENILGGFDSKGVTATVLPATVVLKKAADNGKKGINVTWEKVSGATGYRIYRKTSGGSWKGLTNVTSDTTTSYTDSSVTAGTTYIYTVRAYKTVNGSDVYGGFDNTGVSASVKAESQSLGTVVLDKTADSGKGSIIVRWKAVEGAEGYRVYKKFTGSSWQKVTDVASDKLSYDDGSGVTGKTYTYTVRAFKHVDGKEVLGGFDSKGLTATKLPAKVTLKAAKDNGKGGITVSWNKVSTATGYRVYRKEAGGSWKGLGNVTSNATTTYTDQNVTAGKSYTYTIRAYKEYEGKNYQGDYDKTGKTATVTSLQGTVKLLGATAEAGRKITVTWEKAGDCDGYILYRKFGSGNWSRLTKITDKNVNSYTDGSGTVGTTYTYTVRAYKTSNGKEVLGGFDSKGVSAECKN